MKLKKNMNFVGRDYFGRELKKFMFFSIVKNLPKNNVAIKINFLNNIFYNLVHTVGSLK